VPKGYGPRTIVLKGLAPSTVSGGQLVLTAEMARGGVPAPIPNVGSHFTATGRLSGGAAPWMPVLGRQTYPASWQAWRLAVEPATAARPFELSIGTTLAPSLDWRYRGYFVPKGS
jgi:hypothetical protein